MKNSLYFFAVDFFHYAEQIKIYVGKLKKLNTGLAPKRWKIPQGSSFGLFLLGWGSVGRQIYFHKFISTPTLPQHKIRCSY
ncbi:MAG: hypothetical protein AAB968_02220 [Patescibacteria group bacterium]